MFISTLRSWNFYLGWIKGTKWIFFTVYSKLPKTDFFVGHILRGNQQIQCNFWFIQNLYHLHPFAVKTKAESESSSDRWRLSSLTHSRFSEQRRWEVVQHLKGHTRERETLLLYTSTKNTAHSSCNSGHLACMLPLLSLLCGIYGTGYVKGPTYEVAASL